MQTSLEKLRGQEIKSVHVDPNYCSQKTIHIYTFYNNIFFTKKYYYIKTYNIIYYYWL